GITDQAFWTAYNPNDGKFYLARSTDNGIFTKYSGVETEVWTYDGMNWKNVSPVGKATGESGNYQLVFDPRHKSSYFYSTRYKKITIDVVNDVKRSTSTIAHVVNDTILVNYNYTNCPITFMNSIALDNDGNLWGVQSYTSSVSPNFDYVRILPKEKLYDPNVTIDDWIVPNLDGPRSSFKAARLVTSHGSDIKVFSTGSFGGPIMFWDNGGDIHNLNPREVSYTSLPDNYRSLFSWQYVRCLTPDTLGNIWVGTTSGLFHMNPADAFKPNFSITRTKIKGNYLLDGEDIYAIAIDSLNRKWVATASQGALLLNEDATEILMQFDASNSILPSNTIYNICPLPNSNSVMFVTDIGVAQYYFDPQDDAGNNDNVQVIPNPVLPEFTGYV
ncbi:MAG: hypothetical protein KBT10_07485, partial [Bacteroidales bacterium]|nr:hypothetical protein [Candidatus Sodaliphilus aphodohippi]